MTARPVVDTAYARGYARRRWGKDPVVQIAADLGRPVSTVHSWSRRDPAGPWPKLRRGKQARIRWPELRAALLDRAPLVDALVSAGLMPAPLPGRRAPAGAVTLAVQLARRQFRRYGWELPEPLRPTIASGPRPRGAK